MNRSRSASQQPAAVFVRSLSPGGKYLGQVPLESARQLVRSGLATPLGRNNRREMSAIIRLDARVSNQLPTQSVYTYRDRLDDVTHGQRSVLTLKRALGSRPLAEFKPYHPALSFADLRAGRVKPEAGDAATC